VTLSQHRYMSPEAMELRRQDGVPPWSVHPCEVESLGQPDPADQSPFAEALRAAWALRREIEGAA
jgi:hypothetical protein